MSDAASTTGQAARMTTTLTLATIGLALFSACSSGPGIDASNPYAAEFENALENATSDFERGVLEDGEITSAEYEEAVDRYLGCMHDLDVDVTLQASGEMYQFVTSTAEEFDLHDADCRRGTTAWVTQLYDAKINNPENVEVELAELAAACLVEAGIAPAGYSAEMLGDDMSNGTGLVLTHMDDIDDCFQEALEVQD